MVDCDAPDANRFATDVPEMTGRAANAAFLPGRKADAKWLVETWGIAEQRAVTWFNLQVQLRHDTDPVRHGDLHFVFVIDEIQKIPRWSEVIKGLWDDARARNIPMHVVLLGSSPLLIQQGLSESLMGRFELLRMTHWTLAEMQQAFGISVDEYLHFGAFPGATELRADEGRWRDYVRYSLVKASIENDVLAMQRIDKPALLQQLFEIGCQSSGQIVALNKILGQLDDAGNTTVGGWFMNKLKVDTVELTSKGNKDAMVIKFDAAGNVKWAHSYGDRDHDQVRAMTMDHQGHPVLAGVFRFNLDVGTAQLPLVSTFVAGDRAPRSDIFIAKLEK